MNVMNCAYKFHSAKVKLIGKNSLQHFVNHFSHILFLYVNFRVLKPASDNSLLKLKWLANIACEFNEKKTNIQDGKNTSRL